jgi:hypothetical protein
VARPDPAGRATPVVAVERWICHFGRSTWWWPGTGRRSRHRRRGVRYGRIWAPSFQSLLRLLPMGLHSMGRGMMAGWGHTGTGCTLGQLIWAKCAVLCQSGRAESQMSDVGVGRVSCGDSCTMTMMVDGMKRSWALTPWHDHNFVVSLICSGGVR